MDAGDTSVTRLVCKARQELEKVSGSGQEGHADLDQHQLRHLPPVYGALQAKGGHAGLDKHQLRHLSLVYGVFVGLPQSQVKLLYGANQGFNYAKVAKSPGQGEQAVGGAVGG